MNCIICGNQTFIGHHISYDPEISIPICHDCHHKIHHTEEFIYLDPTRFRRFMHRYQPDKDENDFYRLINLDTGELINIREDLRKYIGTVLHSRKYNRQQMLKDERQAL